MGSDKPIGILDSGVGGLSVFRELIKILPFESTVYYGDSLNCPYGKKSLDEIKNLTEKIIRFLIISQNCKLILIACNTITGSLIETFRSKHQIPFVGIEPATKVAVKNTKTGQIGILATESTFNSLLFNQTTFKYVKDVKLNIKIARELVDRVEMEKINTIETRNTLKKYLKPFLNKNIDQIVLGCTHYPFLKDIIQDIIGNNIKIIDPSSAVAKQVKRILSNNNLLRVPSSIPSHSFYTSGDNFPLQKLLPKLSLPLFTITKNCIL